MWGASPAFPMSPINPPGLEAMEFYVLLGALMGVVAVAVTRAVYAIEDAFERLPIHWMWWPILGAVVVGVIGWIEPRTLGVGYENISDILSHRLTISAIAMLCLLKFVSWSISLGSGTSGGTLAPLFTIGSGLGLLGGAAVDRLVPQAGIDLRIAALVGMAALFAGASRALLASAVFAFETTLQPLGLLPLLGGCAASYLVASLLMKNSIMTEKIARRGVRTPAEYVPDPLDQILVRDIATPQVKSLRVSQTLNDVRTWLSTESTAANHQGFPVLDDRGFLTGMVTRRDVMTTTRPPQTSLGEVMSVPVRFIYDDCTVRRAADHMTNHSIGRLPVVSRAQPGAVVGIVTRSDVLMAYRRQWTETHRDALTAAAAPERIVSSTP
jgi:CBS domain-containing protein